MNYLKIDTSNQSLTNYFEQNPLLFYNLKKTKVNIDKIKTQPPFRAFKDESTSNFVSNILGDEETLNTFLYYNFQVIHYNLIANINGALSKHGEILNSDEQLYLIFKGGNVLYFYFNKIIDFILQDQNNQNDLELDKDITDIKKNFKTSDVDMSVYILNNDEQKFNLIYYYVTIYLTKSLEQIKKTFESIYNKTFQVKEKSLDKLDFKYIYNNDSKVDVYEIQNYYFNLAKFFEQIQNNLNSTQLITGLDTLLSNYISNASQYFIFTDPYVGSRYILILSLLKFYYLKLNLAPMLESNKKIKYYFENIDGIIENQNKTINDSLNNTIAKMKDFYAPEKVQKLLKGIIDKFNSEDYQSKSFFNQNTNPSTEYQINQPVDQTNVFVDPKNDFVFRNINSPDFYSMTTFDSNQNVHFISINNAISNPIGSEHVVTFDLYRIKFNIKLNKIMNMTSGSVEELNIPSEFIDVSIPKFYDFNLTELRRKIYNNKHYIDYFSKIDNTRLSLYNVLSTNLKYTIKDLNGALYEQSTFIPWNDNKYNKRIIRLLFIIFVGYFKKATKENSVKQFNIVFDKFISNLDNLISNINKWFENKDDINKDNILASLNKIIYFNDETNNLLNPDTLRNFYNYQDKLFFKIKYFDQNDPDAKTMNSIIHGELDLSISIVTKIIFFIISDYDVYQNYLNYNLNEYNYIFNSEEDKKNYINKLFIQEYIEFCNKFITNIKFIKNIFFTKAPTYGSVSVDDLMIGGYNGFHGYTLSKSNRSYNGYGNDNDYNNDTNTQPSSAVTNVISVGHKYMQVGSSRFTDGKFKFNKNINNNNNKNINNKNKNKITNYEDADMF